MVISLLLGFGFVVLFIIGLINPKAGGFWMRFFKEKKRGPVAGINILAVVVFFVLCGVFAETDHYKEALTALDNKNYSTAIEHIANIKKDDAHFSEKAQLLKKVMEGAIEDLDEKSALLSGETYGKSFSKPVLTKEQILNKIHNNG